MGVSFSRIGPIEWEEVDKPMFDRLKRDLGIRAILALILVCALVAMVFTRQAIPEAFLTLVSMAVAFYFSNKTTMDKTQ